MRAKGLSRTGRMMQIGFIGLGTMGRPMALNLMKGGHAMSVYARRPEAARPLVDQGATACPTPGDGSRAERSRLYDAHRHERCRAGGARRRRGDPGGPPRCARRRHEHDRPDRDPSDRADTCGRGGRDAGRAGVGRSPGRPRRGVDDHGRWPVSGAGTRQTAVRSARPDPHPSGRDGCRSDHEGVSSAGVACDRPGSGRDPDAGGAVRAGCRAGAAGDDGRCRLEPRAGSVRHQDGVTRFQRRNRVAALPQGPRHRPGSSSR